MVVAELNLETIMDHESGTVLPLVDSESTASVVGTPEIVRL
jgi:hypothetical protein